MSAELPTQLSPAQLQHFVAVLRSGGVVACPTETLVGLLADAHNAAAVARVYELKGRDDQNPIGVLIDRVETLHELASELSARALELARRHWPGPLTLVVAAKPGLPAPLQKQGKVAARVPGPSLALELVRAFGGPLTATSANLTSQPAARDSREARAIFGVRVDAYVEGRSPGTAASTIVDVSVDPPVVLRQGDLHLD